ncbi:hypothetical protein LSAT2_025812 [Lamellibrachia satsuma]|nr:hypothetical protein LSAT2_025812 [Lamellibrachia satsuma]
MAVGNKNCNFVVSGTIVIFFAGVFVGLHILDKNRLHPAPHLNIRYESWKSMFDDILHPDIANCRALFNKPEADEDFYPASYIERRRQFELKVTQVTGVAKEQRKRNFTIVAGNSGGLNHQSRLYYWLAGRPWVNTICETGFNAGHSTLQWLAGNRYAKVYSFDTGYHSYMRPMADYLNRTFSGRLHLTVGDSLSTLPLFAADHLDVKCDVIVVDGGHSHKGALGDLRNMRSLANIKHNVILLDDFPRYGKNNMMEISDAWNIMRTGGLVVDRYACTDPNDKTRGYVIGYYV